MRLLHLVPDLDPKKGGVGQAVRSIVEGLSELGISNEVVSLDIPGSSFLLNEALIVHANGPGRGRWCYSPQLIPSLVERLQSFDTVIVHGLWLYHSYAIRKAMEIISKHGSQNNNNFSLPKLFVMPHGMLDPYFQRAVGRKLKALRNWAYWKLFENKLVNQADGLLFTCQMERVLAKEPFKPYRPKREIVVGLGVPEPLKYIASTQEASEKDCTRLKANKYFLFIGRIDKKKGLDILLKAYKIVLLQNKVVPELVVAGPGIESNYGRQIQQLAAELSIDSQVSFIGMISGNAKWEALYGCEAFILPSHQENFGIAVVEAMACSKPVLISNQVNICREIENAGAGIVSEDSVNGVVDVISKWLVMSETEKSVMGKRARNCYEENFSIRPVAQKLIKELQLL